MKKRDKIFNTLGYSIEEILKMKENIENTQLKEVYKEVSSWGYVEKIEYFEDLKVLYRILENKQGDIFLKDKKKKVIGEIMKYLKSENKRDGEEYLNVLKKEIQSGNIEKS